MYLDDLGAATNLSDKRSVDKRRRPKLSLTGRHVSDNGDSPVSF
jgi:hypothetical protein